MGCSTIRSFYSIINRRCKARPNTASFISIPSIICLVVSCNSSSQPIISMTPISAFVIVVSPLSSSPLQTPFVQLCHYKQLHTPPAYPMLLRHWPRANMRDAAELEKTVLSSVATLQEKLGTDQIHKYRTVLPDLFSEAKATVSSLEQSPGGFGSARLRHQLVGTWRLVLTDSTAVEKNAGSITGLGSLPSTRCKWVEVVLKSDGGARTVEGIEVLGGLIKGENTLVGKWKVGGKGGRMLEVTYASAILMGKTTVRADSKAVLETTYCSERLRVGRSGGGDVYVFVRQL